MEVMKKIHEKKVPVKKYTPIKTRTSSNALTYVDLNPILQHCQGHYQCCLPLSQCNPIYFAGQSRGEHLEHLETQHQTRGRLPGEDDHDLKEEDDDGRDDDGDGDLLGNDGDE